MRRGRSVIERFHWLTSLLALLGALALMVGAVWLAGRLSPIIPIVAPQPTTTPIAPSIQPLVFATPEAINYAFYDWQNIDYQTRYPQAGPMGSLAVFPWKGIHVNDNQFDWRAIDSYLEAAQGMTVTLADGRVISKPVIIEILDNESSVPSKLVDAPHPPLTPESPYFFFTDYTPQFIRDRLRQTIEPITYVKSLNPLQIGTVTNDGGSYMVIGRPGKSPCGWPVVAYAPKYNHPTWQQFHKQMVYAFGQRYNNDPRVAAVVFGPGIDAEFGHATKPYFGCDVKNALYEQSGMSESAYLSLVVKPGPLNDIADWYRDAFRSKPLYLQFTSAGKQVIDRLHADGHQPSIGLKQATLTHDNNNQWQDDGAGTIQLMMRYSDTHPIAWENAYAYTGPNPRGLQLRYFTLLGGLMPFPGFMDFIGGWTIETETLVTGMFDFQRQYLGRTVTTTDEIWIAMRETEFWPPSGGAVKFGGWNGDFTYGLYRPPGIAGNQTRVIMTTDLVRSPFNLTYPITTHLYSLIARRTDVASGNEYMSFAADGRWQFWGRVPADVASDGVWYDVTLKYVDLGTDAIAIDYMDYGGVLRTRTIRKRDTRQWVTTTVQLRDAYLLGQLPGGADLRIGAMSDRGGVDEIIHMVMIKGHGLTSATPTPVLARPTRVALPQYEQRVNAGGSEFIDSKGARWAADQAYTVGNWGFTAGGVYTGSGTMKGTPDPALYLTERWWADRGSYRFDVPDGQYMVELHLAETLRNKQDLRWFDVAIEGQTVLQNFDIFARAGFFNSLMLTFQTVVSDGQLNIDFTARRDSAKVNAIRIVSLNPTPTPPPTALATATAPPSTPTAATTPTASPTRTVTPVGTATVTPTPRSPTATPTLTMEQRIGLLEERYRQLAELVQQILDMLPR